MSLQNVLIGLIFFSAIVESTLFAFPFTLVLITILYILNAKILTILIALVAGFALDILSVSTVGSTPLFLTLTLLVIELIKRIFELKDYKLIVVVLCVASYLYARQFNYSPSIFVYLLIFLFFGMVFSYLNKKKVLW